MKLLEYIGKNEVLFIGGKGGVGKTTTASAIAVQLAERNKKTLIISTDPAHSLGDALAIKLDDNIKAITPTLSALELNPKQVIDEHFKQIAETMRAYAKPDMMPALKKHLEFAKHSPGAEEAAMLEAICRYLVNFKNMGFERLVFDTAPTGHTLRLMVLPEMMSMWTQGMLAHNKRQSKTRSALSSLIGNEKKDDKQPEDARLKKATEALDARKSLFEQARKVLHHNDSCAIFLVMIPEALPMAETLRTQKQMQHFELPLKGIIVNQVMSDKQNEPFWQKRVQRQQQIINDIEQSFTKINRCYLPLNAEDIRGLTALKAFGNQLINV